MKILKNVTYLMVLALVIFATGCQDQKEDSLATDLLEKEAEVSTSSSEVEVLFYVDNDKGERVEMKGSPADTEAIDEALRATGHGCRDIAVDRNEEENASASAFRACCYVENLQHFDQVNYPNTFTVDLGRAWQFEATNWIFRIEVFFNGQQLASADFNDPWVGWECDQMLTEYPFGFSVFNQQVGECCPAEYTVVVTRLYRINFGERLYRCCSESITYPYTGPRTGPPCC